MEIWCRCRYSEGIANQNIPDGVTSPQTDPLWDRSVLLLGSGKLLLGAE